MRKISFILLVSLMVLAFASCSDSDGNNNMSDEEKSVFGYGLGTSMDDVKKGTSTYQQEMEDSTLYVLNFKPSCVVSYQFAYGRLVTMSVIGPQEQIDDAFISRLESGYTELGDITSGKTVFVNESEGKLMEIVLSTHNTIPYCAIGWTEYKK